MLARLKGSMKSADLFLAATKKGAVVILSMIVSIFMVVEVITRYVFGDPLFGLEELTLMSVMWLYMLGASMACRERSHLRAEMVQLFIKNQKVLYVIKALSTCIALVMAACIVYWSYDLVAWGLEKRQSTPVFEIPWVVSQCSLLVGGVFFVIYLTRDVVEDIQLAFGTTHTSMPNGPDAQGHH